MAQYYFTTKGTGVNKWPERAIECFLARGNVVNPISTSTGFITAPGGDSFLCLKNSENIWNWIPFLKPEEHVKDFEAIVCFRKIKDGSKNYTNVGFGIYFRSPSLTNTDPCSYVTYGSGSDSLMKSVIYCERSATSSQTFPGSSTSIHTATPNSSFKSYLKINVNNNVIKAKGWREDEVEPTSWTNIATGSTAAAAGTVGLIVHGYELCLDIHSFSIGTNGDSAPLEKDQLLTTVSGILRKPDDSLAIGYPVSLSLAMTGVKISESITDDFGQYSFITPFNTNTKFILMAHPKIGEQDITWNLPMKIVNPIVKEGTNE